MRLLGALGIGLVVLAIEAALTRVLFGSTPSRLVRALATGVRTGVGGSLATLLVPEWRPPFLFVFMAMVIPAVAGCLIVWALTGGNRELGVGQASPK